MLPRAELAKLDRIEWKNRAQFFAEAARAMRRILIDYAVQRRALKRGGTRVQVELTDAMAMSQDDAGQLLALHRHTMWPSSHGVRVLETST